MKDGPILRQFSWGPQGPKNATDRILRLGVQARVAAATSGFLIFFNTSSNAARFLSSAKGSKKDQTGFRKTCPNKQVLFVTNLLSELSTLSQLIFRLVLTCQQGLRRKENTFGNWIGWELSVGYINQRLICRRILLTFPYFSHFIQSSRAALYYNCSYMIVHVLAH